MDKKVYEIHSEKFGTDGRIFDYGMGINLQFTYNGRDYRIGLVRPVKRDLGDAGLRIMERTLESLIDKAPSDALREPVLHYWYLDKNKDDQIIAHGVVTGHPKFNDSQKIYTSPFSGVEIDDERGDAIIKTEYFNYRCPLRYLRFRKQDKFPDPVPAYEEIKSKYSGQIEMPEIEQGKVLLVLSDFNEYYFHSLCAKDENGELMDYTGWAHTGWTQDSYLIQTEDEKIDIRYFPHFRNIEFYSDYTDGMPLYAENIGGGVIYIQYDGHDFRLDPGVRLELTEKNAAGNISDLPDGDLYPVIMPD